MNVTVVGAGYVGLVTAACLAELGQRVVCVDHDQARVVLLQAGGVPIYEPGLDELVQRNQEDMMKVRNLGKKSLEEVEQKLAALGLALRANDE